MTAPDPVAEDAVTATALFLLITGLLMLILWVVRRVRHQTKVER